MASPTVCLRKLPGALEGSYPSCFEKRTSAGALFATRVILAQFEGELLREHHGGHPKATFGHEAQDHLIVERERRDVVLGGARDIVWQETDKRRGLFAGNVGYAIHEDFFDHCGRAQTLGFARPNIIARALRVPGCGGITSSTRNAECTDAFCVMVRDDRNDHHFDHVGQHTQKQLPKLSWRRVTRPGPSGRVMLAVFFGTLAVLTITICLTLMMRA